MLELKCGGGSAVKLNLASWPLFKLRGFPGELVASPVLVELHLFHRV